MHPTRYTVNTDRQRVGEFFRPFAHAEILLPPSPFGHAFLSSLRNFSVTVSNPTVILYNRSNETTCRCLGVIEFTRRLALAADNEHGPWGRSKANFRFETLARGEVPKQPGAVPGLSGRRRELCLSTWQLPVGLWSSPKVMDRQGGR
jgi:hypothetical protein